MSRDDEIIRLRTERKLSVERISTMVGASAPIVKEVLVKNGLMDVKAERVKRPLSSDHALIGQKLSAHRITVAQHEPSQAAAALQMTTWRLTAIERGVMDLTLVDLQKIASYCQTQVANLLATLQPSKRFA
jgi:hypothetical protein